MFIRFSYALKGGKQMMTGDYRPTQSSEWSSTILMDYFREELVKKISMLRRSLPQDFALAKEVLDLTERSLWPSPSYVEAAELFDPTWLAQAMSDRLHLLNRELQSESTDFDEKLIFLSNTLPWLDAVSEDHLTRPTKYESSIEDGPQGKFMTTGNLGVPCFSGVAEHAIH